jgi:hypothetical protein
MTEKRRFTAYLAEDVYAHAVRDAAQNGQSVSVWIERALRHHMAAQAALAAARNEPPPYRSSVGEGNPRNPRGRK